MKKSLVITLFALAVSLSGNAIRPIHKAFPVTQSDGSTVMLYKNGDGHLAFYTTIDNQVVVRNSQGTLCYAKLSEGKLVATSIVVHDIEKRTSEEKSFVAVNELKPTDPALKEISAPLPRLAPLKAGGASTSDGLGKYGTSANGAVPSIGSPTIPVIMVEFSDTKFQETTTVDKLSRFMNEEGYCEDNTYEKGSVKDYFKSQSRGMFNPTFEVVAKVSLNKGYAYYGQNRGSGQGTGDMNAIQMVKDAVSGAVSQGVDFSRFKVGTKIPNVIVYYAGCGEATGGDENTIWPHEMDLPSYYANMSGYLFGSYFVGNELYGTKENNTLMGIGVLVHEFGHALGLPDFYDPTYSYTNDSPLGDWSVMDSGAYVSNSYAPVGYNAYERSFLGWLDIPSLDKPGLITLTNPNDTEGQMAVMFRNPSDNNEYFILENRQPGTWYPSSFGSGLLLTRIAFNQSSWYNNRVNSTQTSKRAMVVTADGSKITNSNSHSQYNLFGNGVNLKNEYQYISGSNENGKSIYRVMKQPDGTITFSFIDSSYKPNPVMGDVKYEKITDASMLVNNDIVVVTCESDNVTMANQQNASTRSAVYTQIENGFCVGNESVFEIKLMKSGNLWRLCSNGSNRYLGTNSKGLTTSSMADNNCFASISIEDGIANISFPNTKYDNKYLGYSMEETYFSTFSTSPNNLQLYRKTSTTGINTVNAGIENKADGKVYNLAGQQVGDDYKGIVIVNGKKVVRK